MSDNRYGEIALAGAAGVGVLYVGANLYHWYLSHHRKGECPILPASKVFSASGMVPLIGYAVELGISPIELLQSCRDRAGDIFGMIVAGNRMFIITDPHSHDLILKSNKRLSWVEFHNTILINFFGVSKKTIDTHPIDDDLMRKYFHNYLLNDKALNVLNVRMQEYLVKSVKLVECCPSPVGLYRFISKLIFDASVASIFNEDCGDDEELYDAFLAFDQMLPLAAAGASVSYFADAKNGRDKLKKACAKYRKDNSELLIKRWEYYEGLHAEGKIPELDLAPLNLTMLWASVGNTMPTAFWVIYYLMSNPDVLQQAQEEIADCTGGQLSVIPPEVLSRLEFLECCITEGLRLASGSMIMRHVMSPCKLTLANGKTYSFRTGDRVGICPPLTHLDPEVFEDPKSFIPSRWLSGLKPTQECSAEERNERLLAAGGRIPLYRGGKEVPRGTAFLPFGGGPTHCPGRNFARNEVKTLLVYVLSRFTLSFPPSPSPSVPEQDGSRAGIGIFPPKGDIEVILTPRVV